MEAEDDDPRIVNKEYKLWKKSTPALYEFCISHALEWPSLTVQWLPDRVLCQDYTVQKLVLGTHTSDNEPNYLMLAELQMPTEEAIKADCGELRAKVQVTQMVNHEGEVNRARYMPQMPSLIATKTVQADVYLFEYTKHPGKPVLSGACVPQYRLQGHTKEGYGLSWSPLRKGFLLSGSDDQTICLWDVAVGGNSSKVIEATRKFRGHKDVVEDVAWNCKNENVFGSAGDDQRLMLWDLRSDKPSHCVQAHSAEVNCLAFNPFSEVLVATGSADNTIALFDTRKLDQPLHVLGRHKKAVFQIEWSPKEQPILSSCGADRRLMVWDLSRVGDSQTPEAAEDGPPELLFIHGGHTSKISDASWNPSDDWLIASVAEDNILQIWKMADHVYAD